MLFGKKEEESTTTTSGTTTIPSTAATPQKTTLTPQTSIAASNPALLDPPATIPDLAKDLYDQNIAGFKKLAQESGPEIAPDYARNRSSLAALAPRAFPQEPTSKIDGASSPDISQFKKVASVPAASASTAPQISTPVAAISASSQQTMSALDSSALDKLLRERIEDYLSCLIKPAQMQTSQAPAYTQSFAPSPYSMPMSPQPLGMMPYPYYGFPSYASPYTPYPYPLSSPGYPFSYPTPPAMTLFTPPQQENYLNGYPFPEHDRGFFKECEHALSIQSQLLGQSSNPTETHHKQVQELLSLIDSIHLDRMREYYADHPSTIAALRQKISETIVELKHLEHLWVSSHERELSAKKSLHDIEHLIALKTEELRKLAAEILTPAPTPQSFSTMNTVQSMDLTPAAPATSAAPPLASSSPLSVTPPASSSPAPLQQDSSSVKSSLSVQPVLANDFVLTDPATFFYVANGLTLRSITDLLDFLSMMDDETFRHHVNADKNDFANWIRYVFNRPRLADMVQPLRDKAQLHQSIHDHW